jgi:hypothetical protein
MAPPVPLLPSEAREFDLIRRRLEELSSAVSEYGAHLRTHTSILKSMSDASTTLAAVVAELHRTLAAGKETPARPEPLAGPKAIPAPAVEPVQVQALLDYLRRFSYSEWSLLVPELAARAVGSTPEAVIRTLAALRDVELKYATVGDVTVYRYRFTSDR